MLYLTMTGYTLGRRAVSRLAIVAIIVVAVLLVVLPSFMHLRDPCVAACAAIDNLHGYCKEVNGRFTVFAPPCSPEICWNDAEGIAAIEAMSRCKDFSAFDLEGTKCGDATLRHVSQIFWLERLDVSATLVSPRSLGSIKSLLSLKVLEMMYLRWDDTNGFSDISSLQNLETFRCRYTPIGDDGLIPLRMLHSLKVLDLEGCSIGDRGVRHLSHLRLVKLMLSVNNVTDKGLQAISKMDSLEALTLMDNQSISNDGIEVLASMLSLKSVSLNGPLVTPCGVEQLRRLAPHLTVLYVIK